MGCFMLTVEGYKCRQPEKREPKRNGRCLSQLRLVHPLQGTSGKKAKVVLDIEPNEILIFFLPCEKPLKPYKRVTGVRDKQ